MSRRSDMLAALALVLFSLSVPAALAAWLLSTDGEPLAVALASTGEDAGGASPAPSGAPAGALAPPAAAPPLPVIGVLYTRGLVAVDWNGVEIPVENGTYAYVGSEIVNVGPGAMGVLRLVDGSSVFLCPDSSASLERAEDGSYSLHVASGSSRFMFARGQAFTVDANGIPIVPLASAPLASVDSDVHVGEVVVPEEGGCLLCGLGGTLAVGAGTATPAGRMTRVVPSPAAGEADSVVVSDIPAAFAAMFGAGNAALGGAGQLQFLCRCREIHRYAQGEGQPAEPGAPVQPPITDAADIPSTPPVEPPGLPALALAEPGPPDPFDPNLLPPPAAGPGDGPLSVPPPLVPSGGSGGGASVSSS